LPAPLIAGNWKMHATVAAATRLAREVVAAAADTEVELVLAPPFTALGPVAAVVAGSGIGVAAQDMHWADAGAFTGEISPPMVAEHARYVILGHSERRQLFSESDEDVNRKVHAAFAHDLTPIVCVGETEAERDAGRTDDVVTGQLEAAIEGIAPDEAGRLVVAYEPVWAIGTGRACAPDEASRVAGLLRHHLALRFGGAAAVGARVLYGGSVKPDNSHAYLAAPDVDGALVGGASLDAGAFAAIAATARP